MTIVDASAVVDILVPQAGRPQAQLIAELPEAAAPWLAPDVLVFEVFAVIRRLLLRGVLRERAAARALAQLRALPIELVPSAALLAAAWELRANFSAADSLYAALALQAGEPLLSTDQRLARAAAAIGVEVSAPA